MLEKRLKKALFLDTLLNLQPPRILVKISCRQQAVLILQTFLPSQQHRIIGELLHQRDRQGLGYTTQQDVRTTGMRSLVCARAEI